VDEKDPFPFNKFWSLLLTPKVWDFHKAFLSHFNPPIPDNLIPYTNNDPAKPIATSLHAVNLCSKDWPEIMSRHCRFKLAIEWMKRYFY